MEAGDLAPKNAKWIAISGKVMASVFLYAKGMLLIDHFEKDRTFVDEHYSNVLE